MACWIWLIGAVFSGAAIGAAPDDPAILLKQADSIKSANNAGFVEILEKLRGASVDLSPRQRLYLRYLTAWQTGYLGKYEDAVPEFEAIIKDADDEVLRFRAGISAVNVQALAGRYEPAYLRLSQLLDQLPQIADEEARVQAKMVAAIRPGKATGIKMRVSV